MQRSPQMGHTVSPRYLILLLAVLSVLLLLSIRHGLAWDGDPELYFMNARNILTGAPYAVTGYLFNPQNAINPIAYPPGFPLFLSPIYSFFGADVFKAKLECLAAFVLFLAVFHRIARFYLSGVAALATVAALALEPAIVDMVGSNLMSEFPFVLFAYLALYFFHRLQTEPSESRSIRYALVSGAALAVACAYLTRAIGILLFPALFATALYHSRRIVTPTNAALCVAGCVILAVQHLYPANIGTYVHYFATLSLHGMKLGAQRYLGVWLVLVGGIGRARPLLGMTIAVSFAALVIAGFARSVRRVTVFEAFLAVYVVFLLVYPVAEEPDRYSMPIWPLLFLYCAVGMQWCLHGLTDRPRRVVLAVIGAAVLALYVKQYTVMDFGTVPFSVDAPQSRGLYDAIRMKIPPNSRILARKPTIIALYTGHTATVWPSVFTDDELRAYLRQTDVHYIVQDIPQVGGARKGDLMNAFIERNRPSLGVIFENEWFRLYEISADRVTPGSAVTASRVH